MANFRRFFFLSSSLRFLIQAVLNHTPRTKLLHFRANILVGKAFTSTTSFPPKTLPTLNVSISLINLGIWLATWTSKSLLINHSAGFTKFVFQFSSRFCFHICPVVYEFRNQWKMENCSSHESSTLI